MRFDDISGLVGNTPLVGLPSMSPKPGVRIWAKLEGQNPTGSLKDRIARAMLDAAEASGELTPERRLLEPTSGNTGISLAFLARRRGYPLMCVMPETASAERRDLIAAYGAQIKLTDGEYGSNGAIRVAEQMAADDPTFLMLYQYGNPANPGAHYATTAPEIVRDCPQITHFVAGLGTGGTLTGVGRYLKEHRPEVQVVAAEPQQGDLVYGLRSMADGFIPPVFDEKMLDRRFKVNAEDSVRLTRRVLAQEGIFCGISAGATVHVARRVAMGIDEGDIVCLFADGGWKYLSTSIWTKEVEQAATDVEYMPW
ncbi:MAG TPA: cysteine synthase [Actinomycetota bacterium]|nr:cysteine synthase [Actinomycetota bacterium]